MAGAILARRFTCGIPRAQRVIAERTPISGVNLAPRRRVRKRYTFESIDPTVGQYDLAMYYIRRWIGEKKGERHAVFAHENAYFIRRGKAKRHNERHEFKRACHRFLGRYIGVDAEIPKHIGVGTLGSFVNSNREMRANEARHASKTIAMFKLA